mmetsp:Transcript_19753/g.38245  ORF Transcript_19753/g.38245 Transcript_19753/m.38245 type:complete len:112 (+) Transcript_19753:175-510(+)
MDKLIGRFCKSHSQYGLREKHFDSFAGAIVATVTTRLGRFSSKRIRMIWEQVSRDLVKSMYRAYKRTNGKRSPSSTSSSMKKGSCTATVVNESKRTSPEMSAFRKEREPNQ